MADQLQASRFEIKYLIPEDIAAAIRPLIQVHLPADRFTGNGGSYRVYTWYLDTERFTLYRQSQDGLRNRFKLRVRRYGQSPEIPVFVEIKQRIGGVVKKRRAAVYNEDVETLLQGGHSARCDLTNCSEDSMGALLEFCDRRDRLGARGSALVSYQREAYESPLASRVRVTFDRQIEGHVYELGQRLDALKSGAKIFNGYVVMELKFTERFPAWMNDVIQSFGLQRRSFPKYVHCVDALGLQVFQRPDMASISAP